MKFCATDYETYTQIKWELHRPIQEEGLDVETLKRLYESKLVYLERLRLKCFMAINQAPQTLFTVQDYEYILIALQSTKAQVRQLVRSALEKSLCNSYYDRLNRKPLRQDI